MHEKRCTLCGTTKPLDEFSPDARGRGGRQARCRSCHSVVVARSPSRAQLAIYRKRSRVRARYKDNARRRLSVAVTTGQLTRPAACERCGTPCTPHGHHPDYSEPLAVIWLCAPCHGKEHRK